LNFLKPFQTSHGSDIYQVVCNATVKAACLYVVMHMWTVWLYVLLLRRKLHEVFWSLKCLYVI